MTSPVRLRFETATGSTYEIDYVARTWARLEGTDRSGALRSSSGALLSVSPVLLGQSVRIVCPPIAAGSAARQITTSPVKRVLSDA